MWDSLMRAAPEKHAARLESCRERKQLVEALEAQTKYDYALFGTLAALDRDGSCWAVTYQGGMKGEVEGYLTPDSGELLYVWRIPEG